MAPLRDHLVILTESIQVGFAVLRLIFMHRGSQLVDWSLRKHHRHFPFFDAESDEPLETSVRLQFTPDTSS